MELSHHKDGEAKPVQALGGLTSRQTELLKEALRFQHVMHAASDAALEVIGLHPLTSERNDAMATFAKHAKDAIEQLPGLQVEAAAMLGSGGWQLSCPHMRR